MKRALFVKALALPIAASILVSTLTSCHRSVLNKATGVGPSETSATASEGFSSASSGTVSGSSSASAEETSAGIQAKGKSTRIDLSSKKAAAGTPSAAKANKLVDTSKLVIYPMTDPVITETKKNLGGRVVLFATLWPTEYGQGLTTPAGPGYAYQALQSVQSDYNCKIKLVQIDTSYPKKLQQYSTAGKKLADIFDHSSLLNTAIQNGFFQDLRKVNSVNLVKNQWNEASLTGTSYKGGIYGVAVNQRMMNRACIWYSKAIASKYGLGDLYSMVYNYSWNLTNFEKLCQAVYDRSSGTIEGMNSIYNRFLSYYAIQNDSPLLTMQNGKVVFSGDSNGSLQVLNWLQDCFKKHLVSNNLAASDTDGGSNYSDFTKGKVLFRLSVDYECEDFAKDMKSDYGMLPMPCGFGLKKYYSVVQNVRYYSLYAGDPNYEEDGAILTAIAKRAYVPIASWDKERAKVLCDSQSIQMMHLIMQSKPKFAPQFGDSTVYKAPNLVANALISIYQQKQTAMQAMSSIKTAVQKDIDTIYNK